MTDCYAVARIRVINAVARIRVINAVARADALQDCLKAREALALDGSVAALRYAQYRLAWIRRDRESK